MVIGAFRDNSSSKWQWSDGSDMRYTNWDDENPTNTTIDECAFMKIPPPALGKWYNRACDMEDFAVICERESFDVGQGGALPPPNLPSAPTPVRCPEGWLYVGASNLCYAIIEHRDNENSWIQAKAQCSHAGAGLASVPNRAVNDALVTYAVDAGIHKYWFTLVIGASYNNSTDQWEWTDGSEMRYTNWQVDDAIRTPDTYGCGYMRITTPGIGTWLKMACDMQSDYAIVCERASFRV